MAIAKPVTLAEMKSWLRVDGTDDDQLLASLIEAATVYCQNYTHRQFMDDTKTEYWNWFPSVLTLSWTPLDVTVPITSIKYYDTGGVQRTLAAAAYSADTTAEPPVVREADGYSWPATYDMPNAVEVIYVVGYGAEADVPEPIKTAIKLLVGHWYEHREAYTDGRPLTEVPMAVTSLLQQYALIGADS